MSTGRRVSVFVTKTSLVFLHACKDKIDHLLGWIHGIENNTLAFYSVTLVTEKSFFCKIQEQLRRPRLYFFVLNIIIFMTYLLIFSLDSRKKTEIFY